MTNKASDNDGRMPASTRASQDSNGAAKEPEHIMGWCTGSHTPCWFNEHCMDVDDNETARMQQAQLQLYIEQRCRDGRIDELTDLLFDKTNRRNGQIKVWSVRDRVTALKEARSD